MKPLLILATMLGRTGATAVEGHFFQILREAPAREWDTLLLTPNTGRRLRRAPFRLFKNIPYEWGGLYIGIYRQNFWSPRFDLRWPGTPAAKSRSTPSVRSLEPRWMEFLVPGWSPPARGAGGQTVELTRVL